MSFQQAVRVHLMKTLPLAPATPELVTPAAGSDGISANDAPDESLERHPVSAPRCDIIFSMALYSLLTITLSSAIAAALAASSCPRHQACVPFRVGQRYHLTFNQ
jgi:hypothetical protein